MATANDPYADYAEPVVREPRSSIRERESAAELEQKGASAAKSGAETVTEEQTRPAKVRKAEADAIAAELAAEEAKRKAARPRVPSTEEAANAALLANMNAAISTVNVLTQQFNRTLAGQGLAKSTLEYLPSQEKSAINSTAAGLADVGLAVFKVPGAGPQSDKDAERFVAANQPSTWDFDYSFLGKTYNLRRRLDAKAKAMGLPPIQWVEPNADAARQYLELDEKTRQGIGARSVGTFKDIPAELETPQVPPQSGLAAVPLAREEEGRVNLSAPLPGRTGEPQYGMAGAGETLTVSEADAKIASVLQQRFDEGASAQEMQALAKELYAGTGIPGALDEAQLKAAVKYRDDYIKSGGLGPSGAGVVPRETPMTPEQLSATEKLNDPTRAFLAKVGNALTAGTTPAMTALVDPNEAERQRLALQYYGEASPWASFAGDVAGTLAPTAAFTKGLSLVGLAAPRAALGADVLYGATRGAVESPDNPFTGAVLGGVTAGGGNIVANRVLTPAAALLFQKYRSLKPTLGERAVAEGALGPIDVAEAKLREAMDLDLPMGLADVSTKSRELGRQVGRRSEAGAERIETFYPERMRERSLRAEEAIERDIAPRVDPVVREQQLEDAAEAAAGPLYDRALLRAAPVDPDLDKMIDTTLGREGLRRAYQFAEAKGVDPKGLGFDLDAQGNVVLVQKPSWETLHYIRKGLSRKINEYRDPVTRTLDTKNPDVQDYTNFLKRFDRRLDVLNPDYAQARAAYARYIKPRDFLHSGLKMADPNVRPAEVQRALDDIARMPTGTPEQQALQAEALRAFREGYATRASDLVSNVRAGNPYDVVAGTPRLRQKLSLVATDPDRFLRQTALEADMATTQSKMAISPTSQARSEGEALLTDSDLGGAVMETVLSGAPALSTANLVRNAAQNRGLRGFIADKLNVGVPFRAKRRAEELAPVLYGGDPQAALDYLQNAQSIVGGYERAVAPMRAGFGLTGGATTIGATSAMNEPAPYTPEPVPLDPAILVAGAYGTGSQLNDDGSVTTPDGRIVDPATVANDTNKLAESLRGYGPRGY